MQAQFFVRVVGGALVVAAAAGAARAQCTSFTFSPTTYPTGPNPVSTAIGDVNGDGLPDLVVADPIAETCSVLLATNAGTFGAAIPLNGGRVPRAVAVGDLDGDGDRDIVVCNGGVNDALGWHDYGVTVLWNGGSGTFSTSTFTALPSGEIQPTDVALGDLDFDNDLDVVVCLHGTGNLHSKVGAFINDGVGHFGTINLAATGFDPISIALGDIDGDGDLDVATANYTSNSVSVLRGQGNGTFVGGFGNAMTYPQDVALGDFDGDGMADAAIAYRYGVIVVRANGTNFTYLTSLSAGQYPVAAEFADLDGDGNLDLIASEYFGGAIYTWLGDGAGGFASHNVIPLGGTPVAIRAGDLELDADQDLAVTLAGAGGVAVLRNDCALGTYCVGKTNSQGCVPTMGSSGTSSISGPDDFHALCANALNQKLGFVFFGTSPLSAPFAGGTKCVRTPFVRTPAQNSGGNGGPADCSGTFDFHVSNAWLGAHGWGAGTQLFAQTWSRDPAHSDGTGVSLSNALRFTVQP